VTRGLGGRRSQPQPSPGDPVRRVPAHGAEWLALTSFEELLILLEHARLERTLNPRDRDWREMAGRPRSGCSTKVRSPATRTPVAHPVCGGNGRERRGGYFASDRTLAKRSHSNRRTDEGDDGESGQSASRGTGEKTRSTVVYRFTTAHLHAPLRRHEWRTYMRH